MHKCMPRGQVLLELELVSYSPILVSILIIEVNFDPLKCNIMESFLRSS